MHLQFDISAYVLEIRAVQSPKCIVWCAVDCTAIAGIQLQPICRTEKEI
jgi:hypothetical protein